MAEQLNPKRSTAAPTTIDDLPTDLLIRIFSLLPIFCAVKASLVSRRWRDLWHFIPILEFYLEIPNHKNPANHLALADRITQLLLSRPKSAPVREFRLSFHYFPDHRHRSVVSSWLRYAVDCNVEELELDFYTEHDDVYVFHFADLRSRPVRCLSLCDCEIIMPPSFCLTRFDSIRVLSLTTVEISDELLSSLISKCENLEKFSLDLGIRHDSRKFKISSKSLKFLRLIGYFGAVSAYCEESSLEICTPNLSSIVISDFYVDSYRGDLSSVVEAKLQFTTRLDLDGSECWENAMDLLRGVKSLKIQAPWPRSMYSKFESDGFELERLKHLELKTGYTLADTLGLFAAFKRCPALETLVLNIDHEAKEIEVEGVDLEKLLQDLARSNVRFHLPSLQELKMQQEGTPTYPGFLLACLFMNSQTVLKKYDRFPAIPGPANTHRGGFEHHLLWSSSQF